MIPVPLAFHLYRCQHIGLDRFFLGIVKGSGRILPQQAVPHRLVQKLLQQPVEMPHGFIVQSRIVRAFRSVTAEAFPLIEESVKRFYRQRIRILQRRCEI